MSTKRILTGIRPTGPLHLGHYIGALKNWVELQNSGKYECFFLIADIQATTTHAGAPEKLKENIKQVVLDWLSVGLDPQKSNFVLQSQIGERHELTQLLSMVAPYNDLLRNPTLKSELKKQEDATVGFMIYPLDQVSDIFMIANTPMQSDDEILVPVGDDQKAHIEFANRVARRFNSVYHTDLFGQATAMVGKIGRLVGTDGKEKMSKSLGNCINLSDPAEIVASQVKKMFTDPNRIHGNEPGDTKNNPVFIYHRAFNDNLAEVADLTARYQAGTVGDAEVKQKLVIALEKFLVPIRAKRAEVEKTADIQAILEEGTQVARLHCQQLTKQMRQTMGLVL